MQIRAHHSTGRLRKVTDNLSIIHLPWVSGGSMAAGSQSSYIAGVAKSMFNSSPMHSYAFPNGDLFRLDLVANQLLLIVNYVHSLSMTTCLQISSASKYLYETLSVVSEGSLESRDSSVSDCFTTSSFTVINSTAPGKGRPSWKCAPWWSGEAETHGIHIGCFCCSFSLLALPPLLTHSSRFI